MKAMTDDKVKFNETTLLYEHYAQPKENKPLTIVSDYSKSPTTVFFENFNSGFPPTGWQNINVSGGGFWMSGPWSGYQGSGCPVNGGKNDIDRDAWMISTDIPLTEGVAYAISFYLKMPGRTVEEYDNFEAKISQTATPGGLASGETIVSRIGVPTANYDWELIEYRFVPSATGDYYIGFHAFTPGNEGANIYFDDLLIQQLVDGVDGEITAIVAPDSGINLSNAEMVTVTIKNNSAYPLSDFELQLELNDVTIATEPYTSTIASMETVNYTFTATLDLSEDGTYSIKVTAIIENDEDLSNNSKTKSVKNDVCNTITTLPWLEDFSGTVFPPMCWRRFDVDGGGTQWVRSTSQSYSSPASAVHSWNCDAEQEGWLVTPAFEIDQAGTIMYFWSFNSVFAGIKGIYSIWVSTGSFDPLSGDFIEVRVLTDDEVSNVWKKIEISLSEFIGETIYIGFKYEGTCAEPWYIDDFFIGSAMTIDGAVAGFLGTTSPMVNETFIYKAIIENVASDPFSGYTVNLIDADDNILATATGPEILSTKRAIIPMTFIPTTAGAMEIRAELVHPEDQYLDNNFSSVINLDIQPWNGYYNDIIGTGTTTINSVPWNFDYKSSFNQTLYLDHEIMGRKGVITELKYWHNFNHSNWPNYSHVRIYMGNTTKTSLSEGWVLMEDLDLVFDGEVYFGHGVNIATIPLDTKFLYEGSSLVIATQRPLDEEAYNNNGEFRYTLDNYYTLRSRQYNSEMPIPYPGNVDSRVANVTMKIGLESGSASGTVTYDGTYPLEGARVEVIGDIPAGIAKYQITNDDGEYSFTFLLEGDYVFEVTKHGYFPATSPSVTVTNGANTVVDLNVNTIPRYSISGKVTGNDMPAGLDNVTIVLTGYDTYTTTTTEDGSFTIPGVWDTFTYNVTATRDGYIVWTGTITVNGGNITNFNFMMSEILYKVGKVVAEEVGNTAEITWLAPGTFFETQYIFDDGTIEEGYRFIPNSEGWTGGIFDVNEIGEITGVEVFGWDAWGDDTGIPVTIDIFDADRNYVGTSAPFVMLDRQWVYASVPNLPYDGTFYAMLHWDYLPSYICFLGIDMDGPYSYPTRDYVIADGYWYTAGYGCFMIRVTANSTGKGAPVKYGYGIEEPELAQNLNISAINATSNPMINNVSIVAPESNNYSAGKPNRTFLYYSVERLTLGQDPSEWTPLATNLTDTTYIDSGYGALDWGRYQYAVKAWYTGDVPSLPRISNILDHDMYVPFTVNVTTTGGVSPKGAKVVLTCQDGVAEHIFTEYADENGVVYFPEIWRDYYNIWVSLKGHFPYNDIDLEITEEDEIDVVLEERVLAPMNVLAVANDDDTVATITWEAGQGTIKTYIYDDGIAHAGWTFNPGYNLWFGNMFDVNEMGQILSLDIYWWQNPDANPNRTLTVDIMDEDRNIVYSSKKFIPGDDEWTNVVIDNVPYSGTFYALVHWEPTQAGLTNWLGVDYLSSYAELNKSYVFNGDKWYLAHHFFGDFPFVALIRANVLWMGKEVKTYTVTGTEDFISLDIQDNTNKISSADVDVPIDVESKYIPQHVNTRVIEDYTIWRMLDGDQDDETLWTLLASGLTEPVYNDKDWTTFPLGGVYLWAVKANYTNGLSEAALSNELIKTSEGFIIHNNLTTVKLYPNPFKNEIQISNSDLVKNITITNTIGQSLKHVVFNGKTISTETLVEGIYFVVIEGYNGDKVVYKMVKK